MHPRDTLGMKTTLYVSLAIAATLAAASAAEQKSEKTFGEKTADTVVDAVTPDKDAHRVEVTLNEHRIDMPKSLGSGKTAFVVRNSGKEKHNFEIEGQGIDKKFMTSLSPDESKVLHVDLAPGNYKVICPVKDHEEEGMK